MHRDAGIFHLAGHQASGKFAEVADLLAQMDRLVLRFRHADPGTAFAAAWEAARIIRDLGGSGPADPTPPTPPQS